MSFMIRSLVRGAILEVCASHRMRYALYENMSVLQFKALSQVTSKAISLGKKYSIVRVNRPSVRCCQRSLPFVYREGC